MTPRSFPGNPVFADPSERLVWEELMATLPSEASVVCGLRILEHEQEYELDFTVLWPNVGISVLEVKGGSITPNEDTTFTQRDSKASRSIDPITQVKKMILENKQLLEQREEQFKLLKIAKTIEGSDNSTRDTKFKINALIREIDKCIVQLNE